MTSSGQIRAAHEICGLSCLVKVHRYFIADSRVLSLSIVVRFNVFEYLRFRLAPIRESFPVNEFDFQGVKKALHRGIVIAGDKSDTSAAFLPRPLLRTVRATFAAHGSSRRKAADPVARQ